MKYLSTVILCGKIESINSSKRDIVLTTMTPKEKEVKVTVHLWKSVSDDDKFAERAEWKESIAVGDEIIVKGHMGNNGRIIATKFATIPETIEAGGLNA